MLTLVEPRIYHLAKRINIMYSMIGSSLFSPISIKAGESKGAYQKSELASRTGHF